MVFCGVSAEQAQQSQNFSAVIQKVLIGAPNVEVPAKFQAVAFKTLSITETLKGKSHQQEFGGVRALRDIFGDDKQKFDTTYIYLSDNAPIVAIAKATWYVNRPPSGGELFRLYYQKNPVTYAMNEGDLLFIGKVDSEQLFIIVVDSNSPIKDKLIASFITEKIATGKNTNEKAVNAIAPPEIQPTENWYRVFFTPGTDCEVNIISRLNNAKKTIEIAVYSITNREIVNAILAAHGRGVKVRVITDLGQSKGKRSLVQELIDTGVPVRMNDDPWKIQHDKFAIFDGKDIENGSYNWTWNATNNNCENCMFFKQTCSEFSNRYEYLWKFYEPKK